MLLLLLQSRPLLLLFSRGSNLSRVLLQILKKLFKPIIIVISSGKWASLAHSIKKIKNFLPPPKNTVDIYRLFLLYTIHSFLTCQISWWSYYWWFSKWQESISGLEKKLLSSFKITDRCHFKGTQTLWIQHLLICRIQWPLIIDEISISAGSNLEKKISTYIRKWLGLHSSTRNISIYSFCSSYPLPVKKTHCCTQVINIKWTSFT